MSSRHVNSKLPVGTHLLYMATNAIADCHFTATGLRAAYGCYIRPDWIRVAAASSNQESSYKGCGRTMVRGLITVAEEGGMVNSVAKVLSK